jgi:hypothetical protein
MREHGSGKKLETYIVGEKVVKDQVHEQLFIMVRSRHGPCLNGRQVGILVLSSDILFSPRDYLHDEHIRMIFLERRWQ